MNCEHVFTDTDLASRHSAAAVRATIEPVLDSGRVALNFSQVESVSDPFGLTLSERPLPILCLSARRVCIWLP